MKVAPQKIYKFIITAKLEDFDFGCMAPRIL